MTPGWPHWAWLALGLSLFAISIGLSTASFLESRRHAKQFSSDKDGLKHERDSLLAARDRQHDADIGKKDDYVTSVSNDLRALKQQLTECERQRAADAPFTLSPLQRDAFLYARRLRDWIAAITSLFTPPLIAGENEEAQQRRFDTAHAAYRARVRFEYERDHRDNVQKIYRQFAAENIRDLWIEQFRERVEHNEQVLNMANGLEALAIRQFAPTASQLLQRQLRPLIEGIEL